MAEIELRPLRGHNPGGFLAALGALDVATRHCEGARPTLRWSSEVDPFAILEGPGDVDQLIEMCDVDLERWRRSPVLEWPPDGPFVDLKVTQDQLRDWVDAVHAASTPDSDADLRLHSALVVEGGVAGKGDSKPTHLHFTAGQQRFLVMVRELRDNLGVESFEEALGGPWRYESELPVLGWDARGERIHALSGPAPSSVKKTGVPGAEWLGFLGLRFLPISVEDGQVVTTGCSRGWKFGSFTWPLWGDHLSAAAVAALLSRGDLPDLSEAQRGSLDVSALLRCPIRRSDQGGYGSFGPSSPM